MKKLIFLLSFVFFSQMAFSTDGYFSLGYGAWSKGFAGGGVGLHYTSMVNGNPAALVLNGKYYSVGVAYFSPTRQYTVEGAPSGLPGTFGLLEGTVESDSKSFFIPHLAANWIINDKSTFGVSLFGNGGMNTNYPTRTYGDMNIATTGVNLVQMFINLAYSYRINDNHSFGVTAIVAGQQFKAEGLSNFAPFSSSPENLTNNGNSTNIGVGAKIGYFGQLTDKLSLGAYYQSKVFSGKFSEYEGLFAEQGGFDIPSNWTVGLAYAVTDKLRLAFDVKQILYSGIPSIGNPVDPMALPPAFLNPGGDPNNPMDYTPNPNHVPLGDDNGSGFGWEDMTVFKIAFEYDIKSDFTLRGGFSHGNNPVPETEVMFNILAPGVIENHIALGFSKGLGDKGNNLSISLNYALNSTVTGFNPFDFDPVQAQQGNFVPHQMITLEMKQLDIAAQYTF